MLIEASLCFIITRFVKPDLFLGQKVDCAHGATEKRMRKDKSGMYEQNTGGQGKSQKISILTSVVSVYSSACGSVYTVLSEADRPQIPTKRSYKKLKIYG